MAITVVAVCLGWGFSCFLSENPGAAPAQVCRAEHSREDLLVAAVRKAQAAYEMCFSVLGRGMLRISKTQLYLVAFHVSLPSLRNKSRVNCSKC